MAFLCFLRAALEGMPFFTKCPDSRLLVRRDELIGEGRMLFRLSAGLIALIRSVGVAEILEGTAFDETDAEQLLTFAEWMDWSGRLDFVWFSWNRRCTLPMPSGVEAEVGATDGAAALGLADASDAVDGIDAVAVGDASMLPTDDGAAPARGAATDAARSVAVVTAPVRGGSARVGSIQNDSPKGVAHERGDLREPPSAVGFSVPASSPPHISVVTGTEGALRSAPMPTPPELQPSGRSSPERLHEKAAFTALQYACSFEGAKVPSSVEQALLQARECMHQVQQLEATVTALREASAAGERECVENHAKLRGV